MIYTLEDLRRIITPIAERYGLRAVYLFGSYAHDTATEDSDIDLLIDTEGTELRTLFSLGALYCDLEEALGKDVDLITVSSIQQAPHLPSEADFQKTVWEEKVALYAVA